ncbi:Sec-independent protein translocase subunit TatA [Streptomyces albipurpureus]|uniref:Sec-independent protein translocase protein TatA n=1 Tax=Streptomyces albipurpureus TaxID=2897419 RepID=A0ABT0USL6_9ACTN|nr:Sec-independent protein translocase subunit TatA [Streptomyces sp. CWNU-1]MCM2390383.1 Sec-independent protein translocase subunit TatA [Streptomyces sp. CWNU-1]
MFGRISPWEIALILLVIVLLFGAKKLPDMARALGKSARILKSEAKAMKSDGQQTAPADPPQPGTPEDQSPLPRTIKAAPGDVSSARPVAEPTDSTQR